MYMKVDILNRLPSSDESIRNLLPEAQNWEAADSEKTIPKKKKKILLNPSNLIKPFKPYLKYLIQKPMQQKKRKGTNIPKFILNVFINEAPDFGSYRHNRRLQILSQANTKVTRTRFHLYYLFGYSTDPKISLQNELNRQVLRRLLNKNFDNILTNRHIRNKRLYILFCKKILLRLSKPHIVDRLEIQ